MEAYNSPISQTFPAEHYEQKEKRQTEREREKMNLLQPAGSVPTELAYLAIKSGFVLPKPALFPVHCCHQSVVV